MQYRREDRVKVQLKVNKPLIGYPGRPGDYYVAVTGSGLQLGYSDPKKATRCQPIGHNLWVKDIWCLKNSDINFKFLVVRRSSNAIVDMEKTQQRHLSIENKPVSVEVIYSKPRFTAKEIDEQISIMPPDNKKTHSHNLSNKALHQDHLQMRCQPKYTLTGNNETTQPKLMTPVMNKPNDGPASILEKQEESVHPLKQEEEMLKTDKQLEEEDTTLATYLTKRSDKDTLNEDLMQEDNKTPNTAEIAQLSQDTDDKRASDTRSTASIDKYFSRVDKKFLLAAAAGVAAVSYVGYYAFFRK